MTRKARKLEDWERNYAFPKRSKYDFSFKGTRISNDRRCEESLNRALPIVLTLSGAEDLDVAKRKQLEEGLLYIVCDYWNAKAFDARPTSGKINKHIRIFRNRLAKCLEAFEKLPVRAVAAIEDFEARKIGAPCSTSYVPKVKLEVDRLKDTIDLLVVPSADKPKGTAAPGCCKALVAIYEQVTGRAFAYTLDTAEGRDGIEFTSPGPLFLVAAMRAIDPEVGFTQVRSALVTRGKRNTRKSKLMIS